MTSRDIPALLSIAGFIGVLVLFGYVFWNAPLPEAPKPHGSRDAHDGIIGPEGRVPLAAFQLPGASDQATVRRRLAATQTLTCDSSASLIYRNDVIIFAAHEILNSDGSYRPDLAACQFKVQRVVDGKTRTELYPILLDTLDSGALVQDDANAGADQAWNTGNMQDWVIARLARPVVGLRPYELPDPIESASLGQPGGDLVTISEATSNWRGKEDDFIAQTCTVVQLPRGFAEAYPGVLHLDCDSGPGASGSAVLQRVGGDGLRYLATMIAYSGRQCDEVGLYSCFSIGRRVDDDLAARIEGTTAIRSTREDDALARAQETRLEARRAAVTRGIVAALAAPFPAKDDAKGKAVAALYARIAALVADGRAAEADPLFLKAFATLDDPDRRRPEWPMLLCLNAESLLKQGRKADAFAVVDELEDGPTVSQLRAYLELRLGQTSADAAQGRIHLLNAHMLGGDALFRHFGALRELDEVKSPGFAQAVAASETPTDRE